MGAGESRCGGRRFESRARERRSFLNKINIGPLSQLEIQHLVCLFKIKQQSKQTLKLMSHKWSWSLSSALKLIMIKASFLAARHKLSSRKELHFNRMHVNSFMPENDLTIPSKNTKCATVWSCWGAATQNLNSHFQFAAGGVSPSVGSYSQFSLAHPSASAVVLLLASYLFFFFFEILQTKIISMGLFIKKKVDIPVSSFRLWHGPSVLRCCLLKLTSCSKSFTSN